MISSRDPGAREKTTVLGLTGQTQVGFDSGLLGLAFHPEYGRTESPNRDYVYVFYSRSPNPVMVGRPHHATVTWSRVSRFTMDRASGQLRRDSEQGLIDLRKRIIFHVGGPMFFHRRDGILYIDVDRRGGAISHAIRRRPADGETAHSYIPSDNPFVGTPGALEEFYAIGPRSPHRRTYDPMENVAWIDEIGLAAREEIEVLQIGRAPQNFQWAFKEGSQKGFKPVPEKPLGILTDSTWEYGRDSRSVPDRRLRLPRPAASGPAREVHLRGFREWPDLGADVRPGRQCHQGDRRRAPRERRRFPQLPRRRRRHHDVQTRSQGMTLLAPPRPPHPHRATGESHAATRQCAGTPVPDGGQRARCPDAGSGPGALRGSRPAVAERREGPPLDLRAHRAKDPLRCHGNVAVSSGNGLRRAPRLAARSRRSDFLPRRQLCALPRSDRDPLGRVDEAIVQVLREWIEGLPPQADAKR